jgi:hypothetical protein
MVAKGKESPLVGTGGSATVHELDGGQQEGGRLQTATISTDRVQEKMPSAQVLELSTRDQTELQVHQAPSLDK